jgi:Ca2+-binding RTX toxin-like protein
MTCPACVVTYSVTGIAALYVTYQHYNGNNEYQMNPTLGKTLNYMAVVVPVTAIVYFSSSTIYKAVEERIYGYNQASCHNLNGNKIEGTAGDDILIGTENKDIIHGYAGNDVLHGGEGDDYICGGKGDDKIYGDDGDDLLCGGAGNNIIFGGNGHDTFIFKPEISNTTILDYEFSEKIDLHLIENITYQDLLFSYNENVTTIKFNEANILNIIGNHSYLAETSDHFIFPN